MKVGLQIPWFDWPGNPTNTGKVLAEIAHTADEAGVDSIWVMDHFFQIEVMGKPEEPMLEGYTTLSYLAGATSRARLGTLVTGVIYREPGYLVKTASTLDVLSGGRAYLGIGAGWYEREAHGLGFPFPPLKERFERLEETLQIAKKMWAEDITPFEGTHYTLAEPMNHPQPLTKPHPPILIGGGGEKKTLRMVAQYGNACNLFGMLGKEELVRKLDILKQHCEDVGRDYNEIDRSVLTLGNVGAGGATPAQLIETCRGLAEIGFTHVIFTAVPNIQDITPIQVLGREVFPAVAAL